MVWPCREKGNQAARQGGECIAWAEILPPLYYSGPDFTLNSSPRRNRNELLIETIATYLLQTIIGCPTPLGFRRKFLNNKKCYSLALPETQLRSSRAAGFAALPIMLPVANTVSVFGRLGRNTRSAGVLAVGDFVVM
jgi:hypothetical protein